MENDLIRVAFSSTAWRDTTDDVRSALGVTVTVVDPSTGPLCGPAAVPLCDLTCRDVGGPSLACLILGDGTDGPDAPVHGVCESGLPCTVAPVRLSGRIAALVILTGYAGSAQERRRILARSSSTEPGDVVVLTRERAAAAARMVAAAAALAVRETAEARRRESRRREVSLLSEMANDLGAGARVCDSVPSGAISTILRLTSADCARLAFVKAGRGLEVVSEAGDCAGLPPLTDAAASVIESGLSLVVPASGASAGLLAVPLRRSGSIAGVLEIAKCGSEALNGEDVRLVELFAELVSAMLENASAFMDVNTKLIELIQVNEVAKALNATLDYVRLAELAVQVLGKTLDFAVGGFVAEGFGSRRGRVAFSEDVSIGDIEEVLREACAGPDDRVLDGVTVVPQLATLLPGSDPTADDWTVLSSELRFRNVRAGILFVATRDGGFRAHDERVLEALAAHLSIALENATLYERLDSEFVRTMAALSALADAHERRSDGHTDRVMDYAMALGRELGLPMERIELVRFAGLLHDVGKVGIAEEILLKPSALTPDEMARVRRHSELGASIVDQIEFLDGLTPIVRHHHERFDGTGYPDGLSGEDIPLEARILAVADSYEAMTSKAAHRNRLPSATARLEIERGAGTAYDPAVVAAFMRMLDRRALAGASGLLAAAVGEDAPQPPA